MVYLLLAFVMLLAGCSDWYYELADTDYSKRNEHELRGKFPLNDRTIEGNIVVPAFKKGVYTPEKVLLIQLDSNLAALDTLKGEILKYDSVDYRIPSRTYKYPYVKIQVKGKWKYLGSKARTFTLETICDISNVWSPNVNLMTHLEVPLVEAFVDDDFPFDAAKGVATQAFTEMMGLEFVKEPAELSGRDVQEMGLLYQMFLQGGSDSAFIESVEDFRSDMADGVFDDSTVLVNFADYIIEDWFRIDSVMQALDTGKFNWAFAERLVEHAYGLDFCTDTTVGYSHIKTKNSKFKGDSLVCDMPKEGEYVHRSLTLRDRLYGACTVMDSSLNEIVSEEDTAFYYCSHKTNGIMSWSKAPMRLVLDKYLGPCNEELRTVEKNEHYTITEEKKMRFGDTIYVCAFGSTYWFSYGIDTLSFYLGKCDADSLWKLKTLNDEEFVCTFDSWTPANDTLRFLSEQRPCERDKDWYRSFEYDSNYYICAEMKMNDKNVYTFKDTTQAYAESLGKCQCVDEYCYRINCPLKEF